MLHTTVCAVPFYRELMPLLVIANGMANGSLKLRCKLLGDSLAGSPRALQG